MDMDVIRNKFKKEDIISISLFIVCSLAFFLMAVYKITRPGVQYDEISFYNIALGAKTDHFVSKRIHGIPVMVMPYIGALKAYLYKLVFWLFGVTAISIRLPMILLSTVTLWFIYKLMNLLTKNLWVSNITVALVSTSFCFIVSSKLDWGPTVIMFFFMSLALLSFFLFMDTHRLFYFYIMLIALLLGVYDKSNFIWFSSAFGVSALVIYRKKIVLFARELKSRFTVPLAVFLFIMFFYIISSVLPLMRLEINSAGSVSFDFQRILFIYRETSKTLTGRAYTEYLVNTFTNFNDFKNKIALLSYFLSSLLFLLWFFPNFRKRFSSVLNCQINSIAFMYLISGVIFTEIIFTRQVGGAHHYIMLLPFTVYITVLCGYIIIKIIQNTIIKNIFTVVFFAIVSIILFLNFRADIWFLRYISNENNEYNTIWDPAIYELSDYVINSGVETVYSIDWGLHNQLYSFDPERDNKNYMDMYAYFAEYHFITEFGHEWYFNTFFDKPVILFVGHGSETTIFKDSLTGFEVFSHEGLNNGTFEKIHSIQNNQGKELYQVFKYNDYIKR